MAARTKPSQLRDRILRTNKLHLQDRRNDPAPDWDGELLPITPEQDIQDDADALFMYESIRQEQERFEKGIGTRAFVRGSDYKSVVNVCALYSKWRKLHLKNLADERAGKEVDFAKMTTDINALEKYMKALSSLGYIPGAGNHIDPNYKPTTEDDMFQD